MKKSMYSLILSGKVIAEADRMAYAAGVSRSALINQILAEHFRLTTPEQKIKSIFDSISAVVQQETMQIPQQPDNTVLQVRSTLRYKYSPTMRYSVELFPSGQGGIFRVSARTQNRALLNRLHAFYRLWSDMERLCYNDNGKQPPEAEADSGRYQRRLRLDNAPDWEAQRLGEAIAAYISLFHHGLELLLGVPEGAAPTIVEELLYRYQDYLQDTGLYL